MENKDIFAYYTEEGTPCAVVPQGDKDLFFRLITAEEYNNAEDKWVRDRVSYYGWFLRF